ncbi:MAG: hypothetical protein GXY26_00385 [Clostridiales bacterium]|nr:hypothetical protein [Clostridiales bacterium]
MTAIEILHTIVDTDKNARSIYAGATELRDSFYAYVAEHVEYIRKERFAEADRQIAEADKNAKIKAEEAIRELDAKLCTELSEAREHYESKKDAVVEKIFKLAVDVDA